MGEVKDYPPYLDYPKPRKPITNADKIRAMTDEELASYLAHIDSPHRMPYSRWEMCEWLTWLKQEASE